MQVISYPDSTYRVTCKCGAVLEYTGVDIKDSGVSFIKVVTCPLCNRRIQHSPIYLTFPEKSPIDRMREDMADDAMRGRGV